MKKTVTLFLVLLATMATMKAQNDTVGVRRLNFRSLNWQLPISVSDTVRPTTPLLTDLRNGAPAIGYAIDVPRDVTMNIKVEASFDSYLFLLDAGFNEVGSNDDASDFNGSEISISVNAGRHYIVVSTYDRSQATDDLDYVLSVDTATVMMLRQMSWSQLLMGVASEDSLTPADILLGELRTGAPARGFVFTLTDSTLVNVSMACSFDSYLYLLDNNYDELAHNDDGCDGSCIVRMLAPGTYRVVATTYSRNPVSYAQTFTVTVQSLGRGVRLRDLAATPITLGDSITDSLVSTSPILGELRAGSFAKQYTFRADRENVIQVDMPMYSNTTLYLLDSAFNTLNGNNSSIMTIAPYSGLYRLIACSSSPMTEDEYSIIVNSYSMPVFYVDPANGNDANNGLTAQTPVSNLDSILRANDGIGTYYLMSDYTFTTSLSFRVGGLYPYRRSINFSVDTTTLGNSDLIESQGSFVMGRTGDGDYRMIFDHVEAVENRIINSWTPITLNNITVSNSKMKGLFSGSSIKAENLVINNDTLDNDMLQSMGNITLSNSVINDNITGSVIELYVWDEDADRASLIIDDCEITNNVVNSPMVAMNADVKMLAGRYAGNEYDGDDVPAVLAAAGSVGLGGLFAVMNSTVEFGTAFNMDTNNFVLLDTSSRVVVDENYSRVMAKIVPVAIDLMNGDFGLGYISGQQVLVGSTVASNYERFVLAQLDSNRVWSLRADGKMYSNTNGIDAPVATACTIYPNPTVNTITVSVEGVDADRVVIVDMQGRKVAQQAIKSQQEMVDMQYLNGGIYFVQLLSGNEVVAVGKVIKK